MAITGTLVADFSSFYDAAAKAETSMKGMETTAAKTSKSLNAMVDTFDPSSVIVGAGEMDAALKRVTTTVKTTATPALDDLGTKTVATSDKTQTFKQSLSEVDKVLAAVGINLGPLPKALDQIGTAASGVDGALGLLGKSFLVVAAAKAGWDTGRWIAEMTGLDDVVAGLGAELLGLADVAMMEATVKGEALGKASLIAGRSVTTMAEAVRVLGDDAKRTKAELAEHEKEVEKNAKAAERFADFQAKLFSMDDIDRAELYLRALGDIGNVTDLTADKKKELNKVVGAAIDTYKALGLSAPKDLLAVQGATTELLKVTTSFSSLTSGMWTEYRTQAQAGGDTISKVTEKAKMDWSDLGRVSLESLIQTATEAQEKYDFIASASESATTKEIDDARRLRDEAQAAVDAWGSATVDAYGEIAAASTTTTNAQIANNARVVATTVSSWTAAMSAVSAGQGTMTGTVSGAVDTSQANRNAILQAWNEGHYYGPVTGGTKDNPRGTGPNWAALGFRAAGGPVSAGMPYVVGERGPELMVPSTAGRVSAAGTFGGITVNISTVMGNPQEIARLVSAALVDTARAQGARLPVGA